MWRRFYQMSFFFGFLVSGALFYLFNRMAPPRGLGVQISFNTDESQVVEKVPQGVNKDAVLEKGLKVGVARVLKSQ